VLAKLIRIAVRPMLTLSALAGCASVRAAGAGSPGAPPHARGPAGATVPDPEPAQASQAAQHRDGWRNGRLDVYLNDFGELARYREANAQLGRPAPGAARVVFLGDSITDAWDIAGSFPGKPYVNRGIGGQTTSQMLVRFRADVIALEPKVLVILAGTNDIAGNTGPMTLAETEANLATMAELARLHGIRVVFSSIIPVHNYTPASDLAFPLRSPAQIAELNRWLAGYAAKNGHIYLDYVTAMSDAHGLLRKELADDGLHPGQAGYAIMTPLAQQAIDKALAVTR
jgi:lysophospholipase L1-like esterase